MEKLIEAGVHRRFVDLLADDWTLETLATADPSALTEYKGIGAATANQLIDTARKVVNAEAIASGEPILEPAPAPEAAQDESPASVRIQRIRDSQQ